MDADAATDARANNNVRTNNNPRANNNARADSLDFLAYWRTFDMAAAAAFAGKDAQSLKNDPAFSDMRRWGDGWPVKRLGVETPKLPASLR